MPGRTKYTNLVRVRSSWF